MHDRLRFVLETAVVLAGLVAAFAIAAAIAALGR